MKTKQETVAMYYIQKKGEKRKSYVEKPNLSFYDALQLVRHKDTFEEILLIKDRMMTFYYEENNVSKKFQCTFKFPKSFSIKDKGPYCYEDQFFHLLSYFLFKREEKITFLLMKPHWAMLKNNVKAPPSLYEYKK